MLSFTHDPKKKNNDPFKILVEEEYYPITITNTDGIGKKLLMPQPEIPKKSLVKTTKNKESKKSMGRTQKTSKSGNKKREIQQRQWSNQIVNKNNGASLFDRDLKKQTLASEQRQIRAYQRIKNNQQIKNRLKDERKSHRALSTQKNAQNNEHQNNTKISNNNIVFQYEKVLNKERNTLLREQQNQIQDLKKVLQKQRKQKWKNDLQYEQKKKQIQIQRKNLIDLQKKLQWQPNNARKQIQNKIKQRQVYNFPSSDNMRSKESTQMQDKKGSNSYEYFPEFTQSQSLAKQQSKIRQQQLQYLVDQREKNYAQFKRNTMGYNPTLIPLVSKASYKIISTQISSIVELLVDDLLYEQVNLLEAIQLETKSNQYKQKQNDVIRDYANKLQDFVQQTEQIEAKLGRYSQIKFQDIYRFPKSSQFNQMNRSAFSYSANSICRLESRLTGDQVEQIQHRVDRFKKYVNSFEQYKPAHLRMFDQVSEQLIDQALSKLAKELDNGADEFVNLVFRSQFD